MFGRKKKNVCSYWDCTKIIPDDEFLCPEHREKWLEGLIDKCPKCGRLKDIMYYLCLDCYIGRKIKKKKQPVELPRPRKSYKIEYSEEWTDGYLIHDKCFIYILEVDDGVLYVGHTMDIHSRLSELREKRKYPIVERKPRLRYLEISASEKAAELREIELKRLVEKNPEQVSAMATEFRHHMHELGFNVD